MNQAATTTIPKDEERGRAVRRAVLFALLGAVAFIATCAAGNFLLVYVTTADSAGRADQFLASIEEGRHADAYAFTSKTFRDEQGAEAFADMVARASISDHELVPWQDRTLDSNDSNIYTGTLLTGGRALPFILRMVKEEGEWRILSLTGPGRTDVGPGAWFRQVPNDAEMKRIATQTMLDFERAVREKDLRRFYDGMWTARTDISYWKFELTFQGFIDDEVDLSGVRGVEPEFTDPPRLDRTSSGILLVANGRFDAPGGQTPFTFRYKYDHPNWRLFNINVGRPGDPDFVLNR